MTEKAERPHLTVLVVSIILILLLGYYYNDPYVIQNAFHSVRFILYLIVPLLLNIFYFRIPWRDLGFSASKVNRKTKGYLIGAFIIIPFAVLLAKLSPDYLNSYPLYRNPNVSVSSKLIQFSIFTFSTLIGWEILLRGFLLFGLRHILEVQHRIKIESAQLIAILWVCSFETLYHLIKPEQEAFGMLIASPILSYLAFKTKSIWVPLALHLYIEFVFILVVIYA